MPCQSPKVIIHHDNAKPHTVAMTRQKLMNLGWEILPHPSYSPDLAFLRLPPFSSCAKRFCREDFCSCGSCEK